MYLGAVIPAFVVFAVFYVHWPQYELAGNSRIF